MAPSGHNCPQFGEGPLRDHFSVRTSPVRLKSIPSQGTERPSFEGQLVEPVTDAPVAGGVGVEPVGQVVDVVGTEQVGTVQQVQARVAGRLSGRDDLGPGAGHDGGRIVFEGTPAELVAARSTLTGQHLAAYVGA